MCLKSPGTPLKASSAHISHRTFETHFTCLRLVLKVIFLLWDWDCLMGHRNSEIGSRKELLEKIGTGGGENMSESLMSN